LPDGRQWCVAHQAWFPCPHATKASDFTSEELQAAIAEALKARDLAGTVSLLKMLAVVDPDAAEAIHTVLESAFESAST
jgi:hypothetical protein